MVGHGFLYGALTSNGLCGMCPHIGCRRVHAHGLGRCQAPLESTRQDGLGQPGMPSAMPIWTARSTGDAVGDGKADETEHLELVVVYADLVAQRTGCLGMLRL